MADAERLSAEDEPYHREPITYEAPYLDNLPTAPREKFAANIAAIQKLKEIEQRVANGGSPAFEDEQKILAQYTGWGGLSDAFDPNKSAWSNEYSQLKAALSESEYEAARSSTLTAFYTPATVIHPIYRALERFGVKGGKILEPSMGTGAFLAHGHFGSSDAKFYGVELDSITGRISKQLYQKANIQVTGYENALLPDNYFDCVIGNVPFGNFKSMTRSITGCIFPFTTISLPRASTSCAPAASWRSSPPAAHWTKRMTAPASTSPSAATSSVRCACPTMRSRAAAQRS